MILTRPLRFNCSRSSSESQDKLRDRRRASCSCMDSASWVANVSSIRFGAFRSQKMIERITSFQSDHPLSRLSGNCTLEGSFPLTSPHLLVSILSTAIAREFDSNCGSQDHTLGKLSENSIVSPIKVLCRVKASLLIGLMDQYAIS